MSKSLADLRANPPKSRPERSLTVCLAPHLVARVQALTEELATLPVTAREDAEGNQTGPPRKMGEGENPRAVEIRTELETVVAEMAEHEGELTLRAGTDGDWRNWTNAHPARAEGEPGYARDQEVTQGYCNADALIDALGTYAAAWNGDPLADGDWQMLADNLGGPDLKQAATAVVSMHESRLDFRQWRTGLSANLDRWRASEQPETPESPLDVSTGGSPEPPNTDTTTPESPAA